MPLSKTEIYLKEVISYVKFPFDRDSITKELNGHLADRKDDFAKDGYTIEVAEDMAIDVMGNAKEIGTEMNRQHNPFIGWIWKVTNTMLIAVLIFSSIFLVIPMIYVIFGSFSNNPARDIPKENIAYSIEIDEKVIMDDRVIYFDSLIYEKDGTMNVITKNYQKKRMLGGWSFSHIGTLSDNLGNTYNGSGASSGMIPQYGISVVENFPEDATTLTIDYDRYNRKFHLAIPLKAGTSDE